MSEDEKLINQCILKHCAAWWDICEASICQICDVPLTVSTGVAEDGQPQGNFSFISKGGKQCNIKWGALQSYYEIAAVDVDEEPLRFDHRLLDDDEYAERKVARVLMLKTDLMIDLINKAYRDEQYTSQDAQEFYSTHSDNIERMKMQAPNIRKESEQE